MPRVAITVPGRNSQPYRFELDRQKVTIGRSSDNDIVIDCPSVSGSHCTMERVDGGYILRDQKSTNGLKLDSEKMNVIDLRNGIDVMVGDAEFEYSLSDKELDELDEENFVPHAKKALKEEEEDGADERDTDLEEEPAHKKNRKPKVVTPPSRSVPAPPLPSASAGGSGFFGFAMFICGFLAFYAGLDHSYSGRQKDAGRDGEISLFQDIRDGRPPVPESDENANP